MSTCPRSRGATSARRWSPPPITPNGGGLGENRVNWITEQIAGTQQLGTHLDALSHLQIGDRGYNGWTVAELAGTAGVNRLGVETVPQIVTRGWLVDVAPLGAGDGDRRPGHRSRRPATRCSSTPAGARTGTTPRPTSPASRARAGTSPSGWRSAASRSPAATPGATAGPGRGPRPAVRGPAAPQRRSTACSSSRTSTRASSRADGVREFALILTHPKLRGATGAWTSPIALV